MRKQCRCRERQRLRSQFDDDDRPSSVRCLASHQYWKSCSFGETVKFISCLRTKWMFERGKQYTYCLVNYGAILFRVHSANSRKTYDFATKIKKNTAYYSGRLETIFQPVCTSTQLASLFVCVCAIIIIVCFACGYWADCDFSAWFCLLIVVVVCARARVVTLNKRSSEEVLRLYRNAFVRVRDFRSFIQIGDRQLACLWIKQKQAHKIKTRTISIWFWLFCTLVEDVVASLLRVVNVCWLPYYITSARQISWKCEWT